MNPIHNVPIYVESHSMMVQAHEHPQFDPVHTRQLLEHINGLFAFERDFGGIDGIEQATLIQFRNPEHAGKVGSMVKRLIQLPLYFQEVRHFVPLDELQLHQRMLLAAATGYMLMGRDEVIAVLHEVPHGHIFCDTFEVNTDGVARSLAGYYADSIVRDSKPKYISKLNITEVGKAISQAIGDLYWWSGKKQAFNHIQVERMRNTIRLLRAHENFAPDERTSSGAVIRRSFIQNGNTGSVSHILREHAGWRRYPTSSDAWYFGCWTNPVLRQTLTYAEQDVSHVICDNDEQFQQELANMAQFHGTNRSPSAMGYGEDGSTAYFDSLFFMQGAQRTARFDSGGKDGNQWTAPLFGSLSLEHPAVLALTKDALMELPADAFELDKLNPRAFVPHVVRAKLTTAGYELVVGFSDGQVAQCEVTLQTEEA
ncbi:MAG: hypothetical protein U1E02_19050 [Hydrogenophaga sp.]|nr:hypothetical protein [Hydrogenophaga sp.]